MDRAAAREFLGVTTDAGAADVMAAYARRSRGLKRFLVQAASVAERDRARRALKNLVVIRDLALDPHHAHDLRRRRAERRPALVDDWWRPEDGVPVLVLDREAVFAWLGVGRSPAAAMIRRVLGARARRLKVRIAHAASEFEMRLYQQALLDLRRVAETALATSEGSSFEVLRASSPRLSRPLDRDETMTDASPPA